MSSNLTGEEQVYDSLLHPAETILFERLARYLVLDKEIFGEPGWDILLCAFIAHRKGVACTSEGVASTIGLGLATTKRWINLLVERKMLTSQNGIFTIADETEQKISRMFQAQVNEIRKSASIELRRHMEATRRQS